MDWGLQRLSGKKVNWGQVGSAAVQGCGMGMLGGLGSMLKWGKKAATGCKVGVNSFTGDTPILMADGTHKPIKDIHVGDRVLATDPETGETGPRAVMALIQSVGEKQLVDIAVDSDGTAGSTNKLTATDGHPFWTPELGQWAEAGDLNSGQLLQTSAGTWIQITATSTRATSTTVYNLTVDELHTYYVEVGATDVLVHNAGCGPVNGAEPSMIGKKGVSRAEKELTAAGHRVLGKEFHIQLPGLVRGSKGSYRKFDLVTEKDGVLFFHEVKNGRRAGYGWRQRRMDDALMQVGGIPYGSGAGSMAGNWLSPEEFVINIIKY
ncbi:polymorphic toxin-type HINT domain-containing protein [Streptomyces tritici]|uniref:polymorphic toxin-type HINT domain-containing protein n=1 Tax=Streptomyces tritici TaxID=2054410 RepID=UPI003AF04E14